METYVPSDILSKIILWLRDHSFLASSIVPLDRKAGTVRVSLLSSRLLNMVEEEIRVLVEVWQRDQETGFDEASRIYALCAYSSGNQEVFPGVVCYQIQPERPVEHPDIDAPDLTRFQLIVTLRVRMERKEC